MLMIAISSLYGILINKNGLTAIAVAVGYCAVILTIFVLNEVWRQDDPT